VFLAACFGSLFGFGNYGGACGNFGCIFFGLILFFWSFFPLSVPSFVPNHGTKGFSLLSGLGQDRAIVCCSARSYSIAIWLILELYFNFWIELRDSFMYFCATFRSF